MSTPLSTIKAPAPQGGTGGPPDAVVPLTAIHPVARVDLMPPGVRAARRFQRARGLMALAVAVTALVAGGLLLAARQDAAAAQDELAAEQARTATLQAQATQYSEVPALISSIDRADAALSTAMGAEIAWYPYLDDLSRSAPESVWFDQVSFTNTAGDPQPVDLLADPDAAATISMRGGALSHADVVAWLEAMSGLVDWTDPLFSQSAVEPTGGAVTFDSSARLSKDAYTQRFTTGLPAAGDGSSGTGSSGTVEGGQ